MSGHLRFGLLVLGVVACAAIAAGPAHAAKKTRDQFWTRPDYAQFAVDRVALFPVTSYDNNIQNENMVAAALGPAFKPLGYRWISGTTTRELMRSNAGGDSLLRALRGQVQANAQLDSLTTLRLAGILHCDAVLTVRVDQFEQHQPEWNVAGKPYTTVRLKAALVDSLGRLLWSGSGTETGEGPYYDPSANPVAVNDTGLDRKPVSAQGGAPTYREVLTALFSRWKDQFPTKPAPAAPPAAPAPPAAADSAATPR